MDQNKKRKTDAADENEALKRYILGNAMEDASTCRSLRRCFDRIVDTCVVRFPGAMTAERVRDAKAAGRALAHLSENTAIFDPFVGDDAHDVMMAEALWAAIDQREPEKDEEDEDSEDGEDEDGEDGEDEDGEDGERNVEEQQVE